MHDAPAAYLFLDRFFFVFHLALIFLILFGWIWPKTRRLNLLVVCLTALSWYVLGIFYGFGYCPLTEWHWQVRYRLGHLDMPSSYVKFLVDTLFGLDVDQKLTDIVTIALFHAALFASVGVNVRDFLRRRREGPARAG